MNKFVGIFCFSLFMGTLVGLSSTPIVSGLVATLTGLLGLILGLSNKGTHESEETVTDTSTTDRLARKLARRQVDYSAIGIFGAAALAGVFLGLYVRTVQPWHPTPAERFSQWQDIGIDDQRIGELIVFEQLGLLPKGLSQTDDALDPAIRSAVLFSAEASIVSKLDPDNFPSIDALQTAWMDQGGNWSLAAQHINQQNLSDSEERTAFEVVWSIISK